MTVQRQFAFGANWQRLVSLVDDERVEQAQASLVRMLGLESLEGLSFLDVGSGSGLFSLAAVRLGARVHSFDIDADSVACSLELRDRFGVPPERWCIERGSVLDDAFMSRLGRFDVVYSWGVLHHTGAMHEAIRRCAEHVCPGGLLYVALYARTRLDWFWRIEKRLYSASPAAVQAGARRLFALKTRVASVVKRRDHSRFLEGYTQRNGRAMDYEVDLHDWLGGYPYESMTGEEAQRFVASLGFVPVTAVATRGIPLGLSSGGCNEYVFRRLEQAARD